MAETGEQAGLGYTVETVFAPTDGIDAEGVISISPPVLVGSALARVMEQAGYATHGVEFEQVFSGSTQSLVLVRTTPGRDKPTVPGYVTGHERITTIAQARWPIVVASLAAFLNDVTPPAPAA